MATYLLVWNPRQWPWSKMKVLRDQVTRHGTYAADWTCASKDVKPGDRMFLIKLGTTPKGIMGSGYARSRPRMKPHYKEARARRGDLQQFVKVEFDTLLNPADSLNRESLSRGVLGEMHWDSQASGVHIREDIARALEREWARFRPQRAVRPPLEFATFEGLRREQTLYRYGRNRRLRDLALERADGVCATCEEDYSSKLDGIGVRVLQVHHKKQLAVLDRPRLNTVNDLAVLCANCHALIHVDPKRAMTVGELRRRLDA
jgi:5-methylcytosine-specific restriction protein A